MPKPRPTSVVAHHGRKKRPWLPMLIIVLVLGAGFLTYRLLNPPSNTYFSEAVRLGDVQATVSLKGVIAIFGPDMVIRANATRADLTNVAIGQQADFSTLGEAKLYRAVLSRIETPAGEPAEMPAAESPADAASQDEGAAEDGQTAETEAPAAAPREIPAWERAAPREGEFYSAILLIANPDRALTPGMGVQVNILMGKATQARVIPATALGPQAADGRYLVQVVERSGRLAQRQVVVGLSDGLVVEIKDGLQLGETVVTGKGVSLKARDCSAWRTLFQKNPTPC